MSTKEILSSAIQMDAFKSKARADYSALMVRRDSAMRTLTNSGNDSAWFAALERNSFKTQEAVNELHREVDVLERRTANAKLSRDRMNSLKTKVNEALGQAMQHFAAVQISLEQSIDRIKAAHRSTQIRRKEHADHLHTQGLPRNVAELHARPTAMDVDGMLESLKSQELAAESVRSIRSSIERTAHAALDAWKEKPHLAESLPGVSDFVAAAKAQCEKEQADA